MTARGESDVFRELFREPFGRTALANFEATPAPVAPFGVASADVDRLYTHLMLLGVTQRTELAMRIWGSILPTSLSGAVTDSVHTAGLAAAALSAPSTGDPLSRQAATILQLPEERGWSPLHQRVVHVICIA